MKLILDIVFIEEQSHPIQEVVRGIAGHPLEVGSRLAYTSQEEEAQSHIRYTYLLDRRVKARVSRAHKTWAGPVQRTHEDF